MGEMIIDGINWLDPRMAGVKCWFKHSTSDWTLGYLHKVVVDTPPSTFASRMPNSEYVEWYPHCRIAQGKKTAYDGKGQPIPDGIRVKVWAGVITCSIKIAQSVDWDSDITHYQIWEV